MKNAYKVLEQQEYSNGRLSIVPIRFSDRHKIRVWRNEQIYHLRQENYLSEEDQDHYFDKVIKKTFSEDQPKQVLFSYLEDGECIGYGGLVHINWGDQNAEISFLMKTDIKGQEYESYMISFMGLIEQVAFKELNLHKLFTYAYDMRPEIYRILEKSGFKREAILKEHCCREAVFIDVIIHAKFKP